MQPLLQQASSQIYEQGGTPGPGGNGIQGAWEDGLCSGVNSRCVAFAGTNHARELEGIAEFCLFLVESMLYGENSKFVMR